MTVSRTKFVLTKCEKKCIKALLYVPNKYEFVHAATVEFVHAATDESGHTATDEFGHTNTS